VEFDGDEISGEGGTLAFIINLVAANYPSHTFDFLFWGAVGANNADVRCLFVFMCFYDAE